MVEGTGDGGGGGEVWSWDQVEEAGGGGDVGGGGYVLWLWECDEEDGGVAIGEWSSEGCGGCFPAH